jgi:hypothetical protein
MRTRQSSTDLYSLILLLIQFITLRVRALPGARSFSFDRAAGRRRHEAEEVGPELPHAGLVARRGVRQLVAPCRPAALPRLLGEEERPHLAPFEAANSSNLWRKNSDQFAGRRENVP